MPLSRSRFYTRRHLRKIGARITIDKAQVAGRATFVACVNVGRAGQRGGAVAVKQTATCDSGRNPRLAVANAFAKLSQQMKWRGEHGRGAFASYRRK